MDHVDVINNSNHQQLSNQDVDKIILKKLKKNKKLDLKPTPNTYTTYAILGKASSDFIGQFDDEKTQKTYYPKLIRYFGKTINFRSRINNHNCHGIISKVSKPDEDPQDIDPNVSVVMAYGSKQQ